MIGEYEGSGFKEAPYLARRADGQTLQLTALLYSVASHADGQRDHAAIAAAVSEDIGRKVSPDNVRFLVEKKLRPLGVLAAADGSSPELERPDPLLALKFRTAVIPERFTRALTTIFRPLFWPPVAALAIAAFLALDAWLFLDHGIAQGLRHAIYQPLLLLGMFAGVVIATAFHEIGHATACRYGGAKPGVMGVGLYIVWPAFYTDVTDAYRLGRGGRLRTDLGGIYFNAIFALAIGGAVRAHELRAAAAARAAPDLRDAPAAAAVPAARRLLHPLRPHGRAGHVLAHQARVPQPQAGRGGRSARDRAQAVGARRGHRLRPDRRAAARVRAADGAAARAARVRDGLRLARRAVRPRSRPRSPTAPRSASRRARCSCCCSPSRPPASRSPSPASARAPACARCAGPRAGRSAAPRSSSPSPP